MHCFTIGEPTGIIHAGIKIHQNQHPVGMRWGNNPKDSQIIPLSKAQYQIVKELREAGKIDDSPVVLVKADIQTNGSGLKFEMEEDPNDPRALVYIYTATAAGSSLEIPPEDANPDSVKFTANTYVHEEMDLGGKYKRIKRTYQSFEQAVGIKIIGFERVVADGAQWNEALLIMQPKSSFRVVRGGDIRGLIPEFVLSWPGPIKACSRRTMECRCTIRVTVPEKYKFRLTSGESRP
jgi:hypothetical protein